MDRIWQKHYDEHVPKSIDYPDKSIYDFFSDSVSSRGEHPATIFFNGKISYDAYTRYVDRFAAALAERGVKKGDRVALLLPNCPQFLIAYYATMKIGAVAVLMNPLNVERELEHKFADSGAKTVVFLDMLWPKVAAAKNDALTNLISTKLGDLAPFLFRQLIPAMQKRQGMVAKLPANAGIEKFTDLLKTTAPPPQKAKLGPEELAVLIYTGGTTGGSKGVMLSHGAMTANALQASTWVRVNSDDLMLGILPFFHGFGNSVIMNATIFKGGTLVVLPRFDVADTVKVIAKHQPTLFAGVPTMFIAINNFAGLEKYSLRSLKACFVGAAPLPIDVKHEFEKKTGCTMVEGYGLTETVTAQCCNPARGVQKPGSIGLPFPDVEMKIVDLETGTKEMPTGETGEIIIKSPCMMTGYYKRPEATAETIRDGWLFTGDIGRVDEDGFLYIVDRKKEMIIAGGFNIFPSDIEDVLYSHPAIKEAAVIGIPDKYRGETVKAYIVLRAGESISIPDLVDHCKKNLTPYMVPKHFEVREDLPKSAIGKILKKDLKAAELEKS